MWFSTTTKNFTPSPYASIYIELKLLSWMLMHHRLRHGMNGELRAGGHVSMPTVDGVGHVTRRYSISRAR